MSGAFSLGSTVSMRSSIGASFRVHSSLNPYMQEAEKFKMLFVQTVAKEQSKYLYATLFDSLHRNRVTVLKTAGSPL